MTVSTQASFASRALTDTELDRLNAFLQSSGRANIEFIDGYLCALVCSPDFVPPSEYLEVILGHDIVFDSQNSVSDIMDLFMRHWNGIVDTLSRPQEDLEFYRPVMLADADGITRGNDWAKGFMAAVTLRPRPWGVMLEMERMGALLPIVLLAHENDPDPKLHHAELSSEHRADIHETLIASLTAIYHFFDEVRLANTKKTATLYREHPKHGRNELCTCGSGKKFKRCCGKN